MKEGASRALRGRDREARALERLLESVRMQRSQALVLRGEAGVGKTTLLDHLIARASGFRVARAVGAQAEKELPFAGLHQLVAPMLDRRDRLPAPQRDALGIVLGLEAGPAPDRFLVSLAVLGLFAEVATEQPLLCVVDDAQWLDRASTQALAFAARRLAAESVALVFAARDTEKDDPLHGLPELAIAGLPDEDARGLLDSALRGPVDERVRDRIIAEARGNPLALAELPRGLPPTELADGLGSGGVALSTRIEHSYQRQLASLPVPTRRLMLVAAAEPLGDPVLVWRAAELLGIGVSAAAPAIEAGLLEIDAMVRFRHPLERSAVYRAAAMSERRAAHAALAEATDPETDPDRRAWHRAQALCEPDDDVAAELERSAERARVRGGLAAAAAFLERAAELTPHPPRRAERALDAAEAAQGTGMSQAALRLLSVAEAGPLDKLHAARVDLLRARVALTMNRGTEAPPLLIRAARQLEPLDPARAREAHLDALLATMFAGRLGSRDGVRQAAEAARSAPPAPRPGCVADLLLDGLAVYLTEGLAPAAPVLREAVAAVRGPDAPAHPRWLWLAHLTAASLWDDDTWHELAVRHLRLVRRTGELSTLPLALTSRIGTHVVVGELAEAVSLLGQLDAVAEATGTPFAPYGALLLTAWQGRYAEATELIETTTREATRRGEGFGLIMTGAANALLCNGLGRYQDALTAAAQAAEQPPALGLAPWSALVELVEAASRVGDAENAADAMRRLTGLTRAAASDWALGVEARSRALLTAEPAAESAYQEAIERLARTRIRGELARAHLLYGEWLRRARRRLESRDELRTAHDMFTAMGADGFARRAARELMATGATARKRTVETTSELTAQESQIVRLALDGLSNPDIAARLFLSPRTVEWHLSRIFSKLNITSRRQLYRYSGLVTPARGAG